MGTRTRTWLLVTAITTAVTVVAPAPPADATTTVTTKGNVVTIHVSVDVIGGKGQTGPDGQSLVDYWKQELQNTWGAAFDRLPYENCLKFELDLDIQARRRDAKVRAGRDALYVTPKTSGGWEGAGWEGVPETSRNPRTGDGTRSFEYDRDGTVPVNAPPTVIAHEFGHLFGLGDDRKDGKPKGGREGTVMVGGVPGVDVNVVGEIDQNLVNRIGEAVKKHLENKGKKLPKCETWEGTIGGQEFSLGRPDQPFEGDFTVGVAPDGAVTGTGQWTYFDEKGAVTSSISITGQKSDDGFMLTPAGDSFFYPVSAPFVSANEAKGTYVLEPDPSFRIEFRVTLECKKNCEGEAVG